MTMWSRDTMFSYGGIGRRYSEQQIFVFTTLFPTVYHSYQLLLKQSSCINVIDMYLLVLVCRSFIPSVAENLSYLLLGAAIYSF